MDIRNRHTILHIHVLASTQSLEVKVDKQVYVHRVTRSRFQAFVFVCLSDSV